LRNHNSKKIQNDSCKVHTSGLRQHVSDKNSFEQFYIQSHYHHNILIPEQNTRNRIWRTNWYLTFGYVMPAHDLNPNALLPVYFLYLSIVSTSILATRCLNQRVCTLQLLFCIFIIIVLIVFVHIICQFNLLDNLQFIYVIIS
jgi:hypothetical protein